MFLRCLVALGVFHVNLIDKLAEILYPWFLSIAPFVDLETLHCLNS